MKNNNRLNNLNNRSKHRNISEAGDVFKRMLANSVLKKARPYLNEERSILEELIHNTRQIYQMNFCLIGGGPLHYLSLATQYFSKYILIEPYLRYFMDEPSVKTMEKSTNIIFIERGFEDYCRTHSVTFTQTRTLYVFWFNVISYIQDPIEWIKRIVKTGDMVFISRWGNTALAQKTLKDYLDYVNNGEKKNNLQILPASQELPLDQLDHTSKIQLIRQNITDITIIHI